MNDRQTAKCPACGSNDVKLIREPPRGGISRDHHYGKPTSAVVAYLCACGMGFAETLRLPGSSPPAATGHNLKRAA